MMPCTSELPESIPDEEALDELLSRPSPAVVELMKRLEGDLMILGVAGKMGPTLARMAVRAVEMAGFRKHIFGVARFTDKAVRQQLEAIGVNTIRCDLLDPEAVHSLPQAANVIYMVGRKFGTQGDEAHTWAVNAIAAYNACSHFRHSRIAAFSTGCVYPLVPAISGGCVESDPVGPVGDYAQSCLGRERFFEFASLAKSELRVCLLRLNYAVDLRYGVLHDIGWRVYQDQPVDLTVSHFNVIWQGDACAQALRCLELCASPPNILNITGPEIISTRFVAQAFAGIFDTQARFTGNEEGGLMYLSNAARAVDLFGYPSVPLQNLIHWQAHWIASGGRSLGKPTHFEVTDGSF